MNGFELKTLNAALALVHAPDDARALAGLVLKVSDSGHRDDAFLERALEQLLTALIRHEIKVSKSASFANIRQCLITKKELDAKLQEDPEWIELQQRMSENLRARLITALEMRLSAFR